MRNLPIIISFLAMAIQSGSSSTAVAQISSPVSWAFKAKKINAKTYELHMTATINGDWHVFSQVAGEGPVPTSFKFSNNPLAILSGKVKESGKLQKQFDKSFNSELKYYEKQVVFIQTVTVKGKTTVKGTVEYMAAHALQALPPQTIGFAIAVGG